MSEPGAASEEPPSVTVPAQIPQAQPFDPLDPFETVAPTAASEVRIGQVDVIVQDPAARQRPAPVRPARPPVSASRYHLKRL